MCKFIHVLLPNDADMPGLEPLIEKYGLGLVPNECSKAMSKLRATDSCYSPTLHPMCDCTTDLGIWRHREKSIEYTREAVKKERRRRETERKERSTKESSKKETLWSRFKRRYARTRDEVDWLSSYEEHLRKFDEGKFLIEVEARKDLDIWMGFIRESIAENLTDHIGIILHWASGADIRPDEIEGVTRVPLNELTERALLCMETEVLYEFMKE